MGLGGSAPTFELDAHAKKVFNPPYFKIVVTSGGEEGSLDGATKQVPIDRLGNYLLGKLN